MVRREERTLHQHQSDTIGATIVLFLELSSQ
jgi:hypothetical protein